MEIVASKVRLKSVKLDGNLFSLLGAFQKAAQRAGVPKEELTAILDEAQSGSYEHAGRPA